MISRLSALMILLSLSLASPAQTNPTQGQENNRVTTPVWDTGSISKLIGEGTLLRRHHADSAIQLFRIALRQSNLAGFDNGSIRALQLLGSSYSDRGDYEQALSIYHYALSYCHRSEANMWHAASIYNSIANMYQIQGEYEMAQKNYLRAAGFAEQVGSSLPVTAIYSNMGALLIDMKQYDNALRYFNQAERHAREEKRNDILASTLVNKGIVYQIQQRWEESLRCYEEALALAEQYDILRTQYTSLSNIGDYYQARNMPQRALPYLQKALSLKGGVNPWYANGVVIVLGETYLKMQEYELAGKYLAMALVEARQLHLSDDQIRIHKLLSGLYAATGDFQSAYRHQEAYVILKDSISNDKTIRNVQQMETRFQTSEKDKKLMRNRLLIAYQESRLKEKNIWIGVITAGSVLLTVLLFSLYKNNKDRQRLQAEKFRNLQHEQELMNFRAVVKGEERERTRLARELHDGIVGQISAVKLNFSAVQRRHPELIHAADFKEALQQLDETANELRETAHNLIPESLLRAGLGEAIQNYCDKAGKDLDISIDFQTFGQIPRLDSEFELSMYRIVQELIHNIIKHAGATLALIQINCQNGLMSITAEDNGSGVPADRKGHGIGLNNVLARVKAFNGAMDIHTGAEGTTVYIECDIQHLINA